MSKLVRPETAATFEQIYRDGYDKQYPSLDLVRLESWFFGRVPGRALDYGCGPGTNGLHLLDSGYEVVFADVSAEALKRVREKLDRRPEAEGRASIRQVDPAADTLPEEDAYFDYVVCMSMLGNLESADSIRRLLGEFHRVLKPGGKMIVDINGPESTYGAEGEAVGDQLYRTAPSKDIESDEILMYLAKSGEAFAELIASVPGLAVVDIGHSSFSYRGHAEFEHIVCVEKPGS